MKLCWPGLYMNSALQKTTLRLIGSGKFAYRSWLGADLCTWHSENRNPYQRYLSASTQSGLCVEGSSRDILLKRIDSALKEHRVEVAWEAFTNFKSLYGFPVASTLSGLITGLSYSSDRLWLKKAYALVIKILKEKPELIKHDPLMRLCLSLARAQLVVPASKILRLMMWKSTPLPIETLCVVVMHMVKTEVGTSLVSNVLVELCDHVLHCCDKKSDAGQVSKPSTRVFNLVLDACVRFQSSLKGQKIIELMAKTGVVADAESILLFSCIYEMNGQRDELKKFQEYIDKVSRPMACHYKLYYDKLLSLHFKFSDLDAAGGLIEDMYKCWVGRSFHSNKDLVSPCFVPIGSQHSKDVLQIKIMPELLQKDSMLLIEGREEYVMVKNGRLVLSNKGLAQIIRKYKQSLRTSELSKIIIDIQNAVESSREGSFCCNVIEACIHVGWLDTAHDILDDINLAGISVPSMSYMLLFVAYRKEQMFREAKVLAEQMKKLGVVLNMSDETMVSDCHSKSIDKTSMDRHASRKSELAESLVQEMKHENAVPSLVYELNCSIDFFSKAKMMEDALKAYQKMQKVNIVPTVHTFFYLIDGYSSLGMYREITILWGDFKRIMKHKSFVVNVDLYELVLLNFIRGGYFERVLEVISQMEEQGFCPDKWKCKNEYLKSHKNLYRSLVAADAKTEAQRQRLEHVQAFRKWLRA